MSAKTKLIVHIGTGKAIPGYFHEKNPKEHHVVFEPDIHNWHDLTREFPHVDFKAQDGRSTGFRDSQAHEVHMHNVINDIHIHQETRIALLREAARIVKARGAIYISATTPHNAVSKEALRAMASKFGLKMEIILEPTGQYWSREEHTMLEHMAGFQSDLTPHGSYLARLTKA